MANNSILFGITANGEEVYEHIITNSNGMRASIIDYGCAIKELWVLDRKNNWRDVVLGFDSIKGYEKDHSSLGTCLGRHANRLEKGILEIDGRKYKLSKNCLGHHLHGGEKGFNKHVWKVHKKEDNLITFYRKSPDGEEGYPGNLDVYITYELTDNNELKIHYKASADADTIVNLSNHSYFNLDGVNDNESIGELTINEHQLQIFADKITEVDKHSNQTGEFLDVNNTLYDFRDKKIVGECLETWKKELKPSHGYDINYVLNDEGYSKAAYLYSKQSGIEMTCYTDRPGMQLYTGNYLFKKQGKYGDVYNSHAAICLETQGFPNSVKNTNFPSLILRKGKVYESCTSYIFGKR